MYRHGTTIAGARRRVRATTAWITGLEQLRARSRWPKWGGLLRKGFADAGGRQDEDESEQGSNCFGLSQCSVSRGAGCAGEKTSGCCAQVAEIKIDVAYEKFYAVHNPGETGIEMGEEAHIGPRQGPANFYAMRFCL